MGTFRAETKNARRKKEESWTTAFYTNARNYSM